ncbi:MAG: helix-turn-helix transcriptional regulator [Oscillospiraceae bacterium]|jgi:putative transcriptional regulator|nr:helix-turn-helix transcriptional regulator [Oscillospiraceae bacterium]
MIHYKIDILQVLKDNGYSSYRLQKEKILATSTLGKLRQGDTSITVGNLNTICTLLRCQPGDLIEWVPEETD